MFIAILGPYRLFGIDGGLALASVTIASIGIVVAWRLFGVELPGVRSLARPESVRRLSARLPFLYRASLNKWWFDDVNDLLFMRIGGRIAAFAWCCRGCGLSADREQRSRRGGRAARAVEGCPPTRERRWYPWGWLKYLLYEWEERLAGDKAVLLSWEKVEQRSLAKTIEHILPQTPTDEYWQARGTQADPQSRPRPGRIKPSLAA